ncbi:MAG: winged helix-turn-helix transcriptional regulator [Coriobacteriales bacterium]|nr:winged helix-turn-helix transcriptional regulator [Coriobacteriales bacterium]
MEDDFYCLHSQLCKALANDKRQMILAALRDGERSVLDLVDVTGIRQANLSQHLSLMRTRGVVVARREGTRVYYSISNQKLIQAFDLITEVMEESLEGRVRVAGSIGDASALSQSGVNEEASDESRS